MDKMNIVSSIPKHVQHLILFSRKAKVEKSAQKGNLSENSRTLSTTAWKGIVGVRWERERCRVRPAPNSDNASAVVDLQSNRMQAVCKLIPSARCVAMCFVLPTDCKRHAGSEPQRCIVDRATVWWQGRRLHPSGASRADNILLTSSCELL